MGHTWATDGPWSGHTEATIPNLLTFPELALTAARAWAPLELGRLAVSSVHPVLVLAPAVELGPRADGAVPVPGICLRWRHRGLSLHRLHLQKDFST